MTSLRDLVVEQVEYLATLKESALPEVYDGLIAKHQDQSITKPVYEFINDSCFICFPFP